MKIQILVLNLQIVLLAMMSGCAHRYHAESIDEKMARFHSEKKRVNPPLKIEMPAIAEIDNAFKAPFKNPSKKNQDKAPLALTVNEDSIDVTNTAAHNGQQKTALSQYSNKNLYFLTLHHQFEFFNGLVNFSEPKIQNCPQFHSLMTKEKANQKTTKDSQEVISLNDQSISALSTFNSLTLPQRDQWGKMPFLFFPMEESQPNLLLGDYLQKKGVETFPEALTRAIKTHLKKMSHELYELCEYGHSDNLYVLINVINHSQQNPTFTLSKEGMTTLLKTSLYSNQALMTSLIGLQSNQTSKPLPNSQGRSPASTISPNNSRFVYTVEVFKRMDVEFNNPYLEVIANPLD